MVLILTVLQALIEIMLKCPLWPALYTVLLDFASVPRGKCIRATRSKGWISFFSIVSPHLPRQRRGGHTTSLKAAETGKMILHLLQLKLDAQHTGGLQKESAWVSPYRPGAMRGYRECL